MTVEIIKRMSPEEHGFETWDGYGNITRIVIASATLRLPDSHCVRTHDLSENPILGEILDKRVRGRFYNLNRISTYHCKDNATLLKVKMDYLAKPKDATDCLNMAIEEFGRLTIDDILNELKSRRKNDRVVDLLFNQIETLQMRLFQEQEKRR